jgi:hypothetical protein
MHYIYEVVEERRKQREEDGGKLDENSRPDYSQDPTAEELDNITIPSDLNGMHDHGYYKIRLERAEEKIEKEKKRRLTNRDDEATAYNKYVRAKEIYKGKRDQIIEIESTSMQMKEDLEVRKNRWEEFRNYICDFAGTKFDETCKLPAVLAVCGISLLPVDTFII